MSSVYRVCGHCHRKLSEKAFKEHQRLYLEGGVWLTEAKIECGISSSDELSEPVDLSDPPDLDEAPKPIEISPDEELTIYHFEDDDQDRSNQTSKLHYSPKFYTYS